MQPKAAPSTFRIRLGTRSWDENGAHRPGVVRFGSVDHRCRRGRVSAPGLGDDFVHANSVGVFLARSIRRGAHSDCSDRQV
jgi:hypothetical protein